MTYHQFDRYPDYKTLYIPTEQRTNKRYAHLTTGKFVFCVDHSRKEQRVYEVYYIDRYASEALKEINKNKASCRIDPDFNVEEMYDSKSKTWWPEKLKSSILKLSILDGAEGEQDNF
jgi:hypothetical protein